MVINIIWIILYGILVLILLTFIFLHNRQENSRLVSGSRENFNENKKQKVIYLIGSLKNRKIIDIANNLRKAGFEVFDDWIAPGPEADDFWREYEKRRGSNYKEALNHWAGKHVFEFDKGHIERSDIGILVMPAGKSGHLELGYMIGQGKKCFVLFDEEPERWDVMYQFAEDVFFDFKDLIKELVKLK
jgi:nucleoside 2-deoxyribosyltransferase